MVEIFESFEFEVVAVPSGEAAIDTIEKSEQNFDLILMDWQMPHLDGIETTRIIQKSGSAPPVIMVTAYSREEATGAAKGAEFSSVISKPVSPSTLLDATLEAFGYQLEASDRNKHGDNITEATIKLRGAKVLLVEDNEINQELALELLTNNGIIPTVAENGQVALDVLENETFDGVLMDCQMPVMDGYAASQKIREQERFKNLPVIAMTANVMVGDREKVMEAGMNDHIGKPINVNEMFSVMAKWIVPSVTFTEVGEGTESQERPDDVFLLDSGLPQLPGVNTAKGLAVTQNNHKLYRKLLNKFSDNQKDFEAMFLQAQRDSDPDSAARCAHTLNGVAGSIGAIGVQEKAKELEAACDAKKNDKAIKELLATVVTELEPVISGLELLNAPTSETSNKTEIDPEMVKILFTQLRELLEDDDTEATAVVEELELLLAGTLHAAQLEQVGKCIGGYCFEEALEALDVLEAEIDF